MDSGDGNLLHPRWEIYLVLPVLLTDVRVLKRGACCGWVRAACNVYYEAAENEALGRGLVELIDG